MLQREHSAILSPFIKLPFVIKTFVLSIFKCWLKTGFTVLSILETIVDPDQLTSNRPADLDLHCFQGKIIHVYHGNINGK